MVEICWDCFKNQKGVDINHEPTNVLRWIHQGFAANLGVHSEPKGLPGEVEWVFLVPRVFFGPLVTTELRRSNWKSGGFGTGSVEKWWKVVSHEPCFKIFSFFSLQITSNPRVVAFCRGLHYRIDMSSFSRWLKASGKTDLRSCVGRFCAGGMCWGFWLS